MTTRWLSFVAIVCLSLGFLQVSSEAYRSPFHASLAVVFGAFIETHRRTLRRIEQFERELGSRP